MKSPKKEVTYLDPALMMKPMPIAQTAPVQMNQRYFMRRVNNRNLNQVEDRVKEDFDNLRQES